MKFSSISSWILLNAVGSYMFLPKAVAESFDGFPNLYGLGSALQCDDCHTHAGPCLKNLNAYSTSFLPDGSFLLEKEDMVDVLGINSQAYLDFCPANWLFREPTTMAKVTGSCYQMRSNVLVEALYRLYALLGLLDQTDGKLFGPGLISFEAADALKDKLVAQIAAQLVEVAGIMQVQAVDVLDFVQSNVVDFGSLFQSEIDGMVGSFQADMIDYFSSNSTDNSTGAHTTNSSVSISPERKLKGLPPGIDLTSIVQSILENPNISAILGVALDELDISSIVNSIFDGLDLSNVVNGLSNYLDGDVRELGLESVIADVFGGFVDVESLIYFLCEMLGLNIANNRLLTIPTIQDCGMTVEVSAGRVMLYGELPTPEVCHIHLHTQGLYGFLDYGLHGDFEKSLDGKCCNYLGVIGGSGAYHKATGSVRVCQLPPFAVKLAQDLVRNILELIDIIVPVLHIFLLFLITIVELFVEFGILEEVLPYFFPLLLQLLLALGFAPLVGYLESSDLHEAAVGLAAMLDSTGGAFAEQLILMAQGFGAVLEDILGSEEASIVFGVVSGVGQMIADSDQGAALYESFAGLTSSLNSTTANFTDIFAGIQDSLGIFQVSTLVDKLGEVASSLISTNANFNDMFAGLQASLGGLQVANIADKLSAVVASLNSTDANITDMFAGLQASLGGFQVANIADKLSAVVASLNSTDVNITDMFAGFQASLGGFQVANIADKLSGVAASLNSTDANITDMFAGLQASLGGIQAANLADKLGGLVASLNSTDANITEMFSGLQGSLVDNQDASMGEKIVALLASIFGEHAAEIAQVLSGIVATLQEAGLADFAGLAASLNSSDANITSALAGIQSSLADNAGVDLGESLSALMASIMHNFAANLADKVTGFVSSLQEIGFVSSLNSTEANITSMLTGFQTSLGDIQGTNFAEKLSGLIASYQEASLNSTDANITDMLVGLQASLSTMQGATLTDMLSSLVSSYQETSLNSTDANITDMLAGLQAFLVENQGANIAEKLSAMQDRLADTGFAELADVLAGVKASYLQSNRASLSDAFAELVASFQMSNSFSELFVFFAWLFETLYEIEKIFYTGIYGLSIDFSGMHGCEGGACCVA